MEEVRRQRRLGRTGALDGYREEDRRLARTEEAKER